jgi:hypothetical protein
MLDLFHSRLSACLPDCPRSNVLDLSTDHPDRPSMAPPALVAGRTINMNVRPHVRVVTKSPATE